MLFMSKQFSTNVTLFSVFITFSKCFPGAGYVKVGGSLGSEGTLLSVLSRCRPVAGFQGILPWENKVGNFDVQGCHDRASDRLQ